MLRKDYSRDACIKEIFVGTTVFFKIFATVFNLLSSSYKTVVNCILTILHRCGDDKLQRIEFTTVFVGTTVST